jgi:hypothetical protein
MKNSINDSRYQIGLEYCGKEKPGFVVRFCGDFIGASGSIEGAESIAIDHAEKRGFNRSKWKLLASNAGVLWLFSGKKHRVSYGAECRSIPRMIAILLAYVSVHFWRIRSNQNLSLKGFKNEYIRFNSLRECKKRQFRSGLCFLPRTIPSLQSSKVT